jgi:oligosaccharide repeat unit polymerase
MIMSRRPVGARGVPGGNRLAGVARNPFLAIHPAARYAFAGYFVLYHLLFPVIAAMADPSAQELLYLRIAAQGLYVALLAAPFVVVRSAGWLHPLFLLPVVKTLSSVLKNPLGILAPLDGASSAPAFSFSVPTLSVAGSLSLPLSTIAEDRLLLTLLYCLGLAAYYIGYAYLGKFEVPTIAFQRPRRIRVVSVALVALSLLGAIYVIRSSGGLSAHLVLMRSGRQEMFQTVGPLLALMTFAPFMVLIWFAYERHPFRKPLFVVTALIAGFVPLFTTGSRSSVILPLAALIILGWHKRNRIQLWRALFALTIALGVMGGFGALRQDFRSTEVDWSVLSPDRIGEWFDDSATELTARGAAESDLAAVAGARSKGLLNGRSYLNTAFFWLPRGVWADKPRTAGTYNMWINFADAPLNEPPPEGDVWGIPVSATVEAFWNFHLPGVVAIGLLLGMFHRLLTAAAIRYANVPAVLPIVVYMAISVNGTGQSLTRGVRDAVLFYIVLRLMGAVSGTRRQSKPTVARSLAAASIRDQVSAFKDSARHRSPISIAPSGQFHEPTG